MNPERTIEGPVIGSYVSFDPTGRDMADCLQVGRVVDVFWSEHDDGLGDGRPRPLLSVLPNGETEPYAVTVVHAVEQAGPRAVVMSTEEAAALRNRVRDLEANFRAVADRLSDVRTNLTDPGYAYDANEVHEQAHIRNSVAEIDEALAACRAAGILHD